MIDSHSLHWFCMDAVAAMLLVCRLGFRGTYSLFDRLSGPGRRLTACARVSGFCEKRSAHG